MDRENLLDGKKLILLIDVHSERVGKRTITCATTVCCHCGLDAAGGQTPFTFHGTRACGFLVLVGSYVCNLGTLISDFPFSFRHLPLQQKLVFLEVLVGKLPVSVLRVRPAAPHLGQ